MDEWVAAGIHPDLIEVKRSIFDLLRLECSLPRPDSDNAEYGAYLFRVGDRRVRSRVARVTPTKSGLFVAVWRRAPDGSTQPHESEDGVEALAITVREAEHFGQFVFPDDALSEHGIVSVAGVGGKRGFRLYPPWSAVESRQAGRTQQWQGEYYIGLEGCGDGDGEIDVAPARALWISGTPGASTIS
jgi:hypothetical protein